MTEAADRQERPARRRLVSRTFASFLTAVGVLLAVAVLGVAIWLDSDDGHAFIVRQVEGWEPDDGLRVRIAALDGSIYGDTRVRGLTLADPRGAFFTAEKVALDWNPLAWIFNELYIDRAVVGGARMDRLPELRDTGDDGPILPDFDIYVGSFAARDIVLGEALAGRESRASITGAADVRAGRAMVTLDARARPSNAGADNADGNDRVLVTLNAEPDAGRLDLDADIRVTASGAIAAIAGLDRGYRARLNGAGDWDEWTGRLAVASAGRRLARVDVVAREGVFSFAGNADATLVPAGLARRVAAPEVAVEGRASVEERRVALDLTARATDLRVTARGGIDLARNALDAMLLEITLAAPDRLLANASGSQLRVRALLNGAFDDLRARYDARADRLTIGRVALAEVIAVGRGRREGGAWRLPLDLRVASLDGIGPLVAELTEGFAGEALLTLDGARLTSEDVRFRTRRAAGTAELAVDLASGRYAVEIDGRAPGYAVRGLGVADVAATVLLSPQPGNRRAVDVGGAVVADMRRLDNAFLRTLGGGLPRLTTDFAIGADRKLRLTDLAINAPEIRVAGSGVQQAPGDWRFIGDGRHATYGPFDIALSGRLERPTIALVLADPLPALGARDVALDVDPIEGGFVYTASGGSRLGPFDGEGTIRADGGQAVVNIARLRVSGTTARGALRPVDGGLAGALAMTGGGVQGDLRFTPSGAAQLIRADIDIRDASFLGTPAIRIRRGAMTADVALREGRSNIDARLQATGISRGGLALGRIEGSAKLVDGRGSAALSVAGTRGSNFAFRTRADIAPDRVLVAGRGAYDGKPLRLAQPARLTRLSGESSGEGTGWRLSPVRLTYGAGAARLAGSWRGNALRADVTLDALPLEILNIASDDLDLGGAISGRVRYANAAGRVPEGAASLTVRGLTRSGLLMSSRPVDIGLNVALSNGTAAARGVVRSSAGETTGRVQARVTGIRGRDFAAELMTGALFAEARFDGAVESLWRLTGIETFDLTGPVRISADARGTLANPRIAGVVRSRGGRLASALTGTVVTDIDAAGRFDGSALVLTRATGKTRGGGRVTATGRFDLARAETAGVGIDVDIRAERAALVARDDFAASVTGDIFVDSTPGGGGRIAGDVVLNRSFFRFGRAKARASLPQVNVREINLPDDDRPAPAARAPWRFAMTATAPSRLSVDGLGLDSEWRADLALSGPVDNFAIDGNARLIRGDYTFAGRTFELERGTIRFVGEQPPNPFLDITAKANLRGLNATIEVGGRGESPEIRFASVPALPEDELLARILFGESIARLSAPEAVQLASAVASLNSDGGLDPINALRRAVGLDRLRILPADAVTGQGTSIAGGKYLSRRIYVELITDGRGYSATRLEFQITRWLSILSSISTIGRQSANVRVSRDY